MRPHVIGLTGNIGCGKSAVARLLAGLGAQVVDADQVAHAVMRPPGAVFDRVVAEFGPDVIGPDGELDRKRLGAIVFADAARLRRLDSIVHPATTERIRAIIREATAAVLVIEAIKLIESGTYRSCDAVWIVTCAREQQIERLVNQRHLTRDQATLRIDAQAPIADKLGLASVVIENDGSLDDLRRNVVAAWQSIGRASRGRAVRERRKRRSPE